MGCAPKRCACRRIWMYWPPRGSRCAGCARLRHRVQVAGGDGMQHLLVTPARLVVRQVVAEVGGLDDQRARRHPGRQPRDQMVPLRARGADAHRHRQHRHAGEQLRHVGQQLAQAVLALEELRRRHLRRLQQRGHGAAVGGYAAEHGVEVARGVVAKARVARRKWSGVSNTIRSGRAPRAAVSMPAAIRSLATRWCGSARPVTDAPPRSSGCASTSARSTCCGSTG